MAGPGLSYNYDIPNTSVQDKHDIYNRNIVGQVIKEDEKYFYTYNIEYKIDIDDHQINRNIYYASGETIIQESEESADITRNLNTTFELFNGFVSYFLPEEGNEIQSFTIKSGCITDTAELNALFLLINDLGNEFSVQSELLIPVSAIKSFATYYQDYYSITRYSSVNYASIIDDEITSILDYNSESETLTDTCKQKEFLYKLTYNINLLLQVSLLI